MYQNEQEIEKKMHLFTKGSHFQSCHVIYNISPDSL